MTDPERIWLQPDCCSVPEQGRLWSPTEAPEDCSDGVAWTEYVRADEAAFAVSAARQEMDRALRVRDAQIGELMRDASRLRAQIGSIETFCKRCVHASSKSPYTQGQDAAFEHVLSHMQALAALSDKGEA